MWCDEVVGRSAEEVARADQLLKLIAAYVSEQMYHSPRADQIGQGMFPP